MVEVASPSTRRADRGRKLADYHLGGAGLFLLVDLPPIAAGADPVFTAHSFASGDVVTSTGAIECDVRGVRLRFDLTATPR